MRLLAAYIAACVTFAGCAPPSGATAAATSNDTLSFPQGVGYTPNPAIDGGSVTITWTVGNTSTDNTALNAIPYVINRDNVLYSSFSIPTIAPNSSVPVTFSITETDGLTHTYEMVLDANDTTGASNTLTNHQAVVIQWQLTASG
jgi:hypothetical protein